MDWSILFSSYRFHFSFAGVLNFSIVFFKFCFRFLFNYYRSDIRIFTLGMTGAQLVLDSVNVSGFSLWAFRCFAAPGIKYSAAFRNKIKDNTQLFIIYPLLSHLLCACLVPGFRWKRILCLSSFSLTFGFALIFIHSMVIYEISNSDCELHSTNSIEFDHLDIDSLFDDDEIICESSFLFDKTRWIDRNLFRFIFYLFQVTQ